CVGLPKVLHPRWSTNWLIRDLWRKEFTPSSDSEINLYLTKLGKKARAEHRKKHETMGEKFSEIMDGISEEMQDDMLKVLKSFEEELDKLQ
ncbi:hypothetical protein UYO_2849, partial [Lachnospiraceae bacterium JC7]